MKPSLHFLHQLTQRLDAARIVYASGGSGLLYSLGLTEQVRDWDLTTDAPWDTVTSILTQSGIAWTAAPSGDFPFASSYRISIADASLPIDVIGCFAIHGEGGICTLPTRPAFTWEGIPMASPEVWATAYALMQRHEKAQLLFTYLREHGANAEILQLLLTTPLPTSIRSELTRI